MCFTATEKDLPRWSAVVRPPKTAQEVAARRELHERIADAVLHSNSGGDDSNVSALVDRLLSVKRC
jgi:hypothetical protein